MLAMRRSHVASLVSVMRKLRETKVERRMPERVTAQFISSPEERRRAKAQLSALPGSTLWRKPVILGVALLFLVSFNPFGFDRSDWVQIVAFPIALLLLFVLWPRFLWWRHSRRSGGEERRTVSAEGLAIAGAFDVLFPWPRIKAVVETSDYVFFLFGPGAGHFIPKSALGPSDLEAIRLLAGDRWNADLSRA
jgi:hypothetical protein